MSLYAAQAIQGGNHLSCLSLAFEEEVKGGDVMYPMSGAVSWSQEWLDDSWEKTGISNTCPIFVLLLLPSLR